jgi:hypothetical protein
MIIIQSGNISLDIFKKKKAEAQEIKKREEREIHYGYQSNNYIAEHIISKELIVSCL